MGRCACSVSHPDDSEMMRSPVISVAAASPARTSEGDSVIVPACGTATGPSLGVLLEGHASIPSELDRVVTAVCDDSRAVASGALFFARGVFRSMRAGSQAVRSRPAPRRVVIEGGPAPVRLDAGAVVVRIPDVAGRGRTRRIALLRRSFGAPVHCRGDRNEREDERHASDGTKLRRSVRGEWAPWAPARRRCRRRRPSPPRVRSRFIADSRSCGTAGSACWSWRSRRTLSISAGSRRSTSIPRCSPTLSRDHLDYHPDMEAYARAKASLFKVPGLSQAVVNIDDPFGRRSDWLDVARYRVRRADTR